MSARFYPRYFRGNPQLRIFLPDYKLVMVKNPDGIPDNIVSFKTDPRMTDWDIKNYLEKIYKIKVAFINSKIYSGELVQTRKLVGKKRDYRIARVTLPIGETFKWPDLFPQEKQTKLKKDMDSMIEEAGKDRKDDTKLSNLPSWLISDR